MTVDEAEARLREVRGQEWISTSELLQGVDDLLAALDAQPEAEPVCQRCGWAESRSMAEASLCDHSFDAQPAPALPSCVQQWQDAPTDVVNEIRCMLPDSLVYDDDEANVALDAAEASLLWLATAPARDVAVVLADGDLEALRRWPQALRMALATARKLEANKHKGGWEADDALDLASRVIEEANELHAEVWSSGNNIEGEAADVANMAMMVADVCGALPRASATFVNRAALEGLCERWSQLRVPASSQECARELRALLNKGRDSTAVDPPAE